jgi:polyhydroxyalkanoate synthesis regulator phasin
MADNDLLKRLLDAGMTFTAMTQARAEELIRDLVRAGAVQAEQAQATVDELLDRSRRNSERLIDAVRTEIDQQLAKLDLATRDDIESMVQRFTDLAASVFGAAAPGRREASTPARAVPVSTSAPAAGKATAKKSAAKKAPAKKGAARKAPAKKSGAKKGTAKKGTARKSSTASAKKSTARKASGSSTKKGAAKKSSSSAG